MNNCKAIVETGSRLHGGFHTLPTTNRTIWASIGFYIEKPRIKLEATQCNKTTIKTKTHETEKTILETLNQLKPKRDYCITIKEEIPRHKGLGSTTQLKLALATAIHLLENKKPPTKHTLISLAKKLGRGYPSKAGTLLFIYGGITADTGLEPPTPLWHSSMPENWRIILLQPLLPRGLSEREETKTIDYSKPWYADETIQKLATRGLIELMRGVSSNNLDIAIEGLRLVQLATGYYFSHLQGGSFRQDLARIVDEAQRNGIYLAQSSWGPTLYTISDRDKVESDIKTLKMISRIVGVHANVYEVLPRNMPATFTLECK